MPAALQAMRDCHERLTDAAYSAWLRDKPPGMALMPDEFIAGVEALASDPSNGAKRFG